MKRTFALLIGAMICAAVARADDVKIEAVMSIGPTGEPSTTFAADTPKIFCLFKSKGLKNGDKLRGLWIAHDVGDAAPQETKIDEQRTKAEGDAEDGVFSLSKPTKGWAAGEYRLEIYVNDKLATTVKFTITGAKSEKSPDE